MRPSLRFHSLIPLLLLLGACGDAPPSVRRSAPDGRLPVAVSIPPQAWLVERLGGDRVETQVLMPPGASPSTFEPSPRQIVALDRARLYLAVGHPDFPFESRLLDRLLDHRDDLTVIEMTDGLGSLALTGHDHAHDGAEQPASEIDPHVWVAPGTMAAAAGPVARALAELDPEHAELYRRNLAALDDEIAALDRELAAKFSDLEPEHRRFWVYHPAWGYLARQYGLEQIAMEAGGKELSAARLVELTDRAGAERVTVVFVQSGFSDRAARALAAETGARVEVLDPLARDWPENLRAVADRLHRAMAGADATAAGLR